MSAVRKLVVIEVNELPDRVVTEAVRRGRAPNLERLLHEGVRSETIVTEDVGKYLYPSQTWASMNTGVSYAEHGVYWYGDPKPAEYPLYWQEAARRGRSVGVVGTLHSSPFAQQCADDGIVFAIPDCFAETSETRPARYRRLQAANLQLTAGAGRQASAKADPATLLGLSTAPALGVRPSTLAELTRLVAGVASGRVPRERLRSAQHLILGDAFLHLAKSEDPDLSVYFTNHIASMMHRYWYALFPQDWPTSHYSDEWVAGYQDEILVAVCLLDGFLGRAMHWAHRTGRTMAIVSSMGQRANLDIDTSKGEVFVLRDQATFARFLGLPKEAQELRAMVPSCSWRFDTADDAQHAAARLRTAGHRGLDLEIDVAADVLTCTYHREGGAVEVEVGGAATPIKDIGFESLDVDDHNSGVHDERGILYLWGEGAAGVGLAPVVDALAVSGLLLDLLGVGATARVPPSASQASAANATLAAR